MLQNSNNYNPTMLKVTLTLQAKKKVVLFPEIGRVKTFLSPTRPPKSNVYENIYFLFQKYIHTNKTFSTGKFILMNLRFFSRSLFFQPRKKLLEQFFKRKLYLKNSIKLIIYIYIFCSHPSEDFCRHLHFWKQEFYLFVYLFFNLSYFRKRLHHRYLQGLIYTFKAQHLNLAKRMIVKTKH